MVKVSGPVSVGVFKLDGKHIFLFGDTHTTPKGLCRTCTPQKNCLFITEFIDNLNNSDVFIEIPWVDKHSKEFTKRFVFPHTDVLRIVNDKYKDILYGRKVTSGMRFHYSDIRDEKLLKPLKDLVLRHIELNFHLDDAPLIEQFKNTKFIKQFMDTVVKSDDFEKSIKALCNPSVVGILLLDTKQQEKIVHRVRKQILKLPKVYQRNLYRFHNQRCKEIVDYCKKSNDSYNKFPYQGFFISQDCILPMLTHLMDMYLLARLLYYIKRKDSKHTLAYTGATHTKNYITFFTEYMKEAELMYHEDNTNAKRAKRCVTLPASCVAL